MIPLPDARREHGKPDTLHLPDGSSVQLKSWASIPVEVARWLVEHGLDEPVESGPQNYVLNREPIHQNGRPFGRASERVGNMYVYKNVDPRGAVKFSIKLAKAAGEDPVKFGLSFTEKPQAGRRVKRRTKPNAKPQEPRPTNGAQKIPWKDAVKLLMIDRDGMKCLGCDRVFDDPRYLELDHKTPQSKDGPNTPNNLVLLCGPCNRTKSDRLTLAGLRAANKDNGYMRGSSEWRTTATNGADRAAMASLLGRKAPQQPDLLGPAAEAAEEAAGLLVEARDMMRGQAERRRG